MSPSDQARGDASAPLLSVCIPTYNGAAYLAEAMKSVLDQTFSDFELIVVDDASTDATVEIARSFEDRRIRHFSNRVNRGLVGNWNRCLELARGTYVCIFRQDDAMMPDNLAAKVSLLDRSPTAGFVHSNVLQVGPQGELLSEWWSPKPAPEDVGFHAGAAVLEKLLLSGGNAVCAPSVVLRRDCVEAIGPFDGRLLYTADWEMWMRVAVFFDVGYSIEPLVKYRRHRGNETLKFLGAAELEHAYRAKALVLEKCGASIAGAERLKAEVARQYRQLALGEATTRGEAGDHHEASTYLRGATTLLERELEEARAALERSRAALRERDADLQRAHAANAAKDAELERTRSELERALAEAASRSELHAVSRSSLEERTRQIEGVTAELEEVRAEAALMRERVAAMQTSKFWKLRALWFRLKRALGVRGPE
jgi:Glycosyl transferase family 2